MTKKIAEKTPAKLGHQLFSIDFVIEKLVKP